MKKSPLIVLMIVLTFGLFADDAKVLPSGVIRLYAIPSYVHGTQQFDADGEKVDSVYDGFTFINVGGALEYGITDSVSAAVQWSPGANVYSKFDNNEYVTLNGLFELFAGAKIQILGSQGLIKNDAIRLAVAPGVMIPMAFGYNAAEEAGNYIANSTGTPTVSNIDPANSTLAFGARVYADNIVNKIFFINLYGEFIKYLPKDTAEDFTGVFTNTFREASSLPTYDTKNFGYELTTEIDFNFTKQLADGLSMSCGVPVGFNYSPEVTFDDADADSDKAKYKMYVNPDVSVLITSLPLPLEFQISYNVPLLGQNTMASNTLTAQVKAYIKF
jgi:hypothetical protein